MIAVEPVGEMALVRLDRPGKRNAMTPAMLRSLAQAIDRASSARAIVLGGMGETFCAGFDLALCRDDPGALDQLLVGLADAIRALREAPAPVVAAVHGAAIAGGCALLGGADFVITHEDCVLGYPVVRLGISPAVSAPFLAQAVGWGAARERLLDPGLISGRRAWEIGLAFECLASAAEVLPRALALAEHLAAKPRHALAYTKAWLRSMRPVAEDAARALAASRSLSGDPEARERLAALGTPRSEAARPDTPPLREPRNP